MHSIADYEFVQPLGAGSHGQCFLAHRPARLPLEVESVAVKVLYGESTADTFRRATRELRAFAAVRSPYQVELFDAGQHDGIFYYSMRYLDEGNLDRPTRPWPAPPRAGRGRRRRPGAGRSARRPAHPRRREGQQRPARRR